MAGRLSQELGGLAGAGAQLEAAESGEMMTVARLAAKVTEDSTHGLNWKLAEMLAKYEDIDSDSVLQMLNHLESLILETIDYNMSVPDDLKVEFEKQPAKVVHWLLACRLAEACTELRHDSSPTRPRAAHAT